MPKPYVIAGTTYPSQGAYRKTLAARAGYASVSAYRRDRTAMRFLERLSPRARSAYERSADAISLARRTGTPLSQAAKQFNTTMTTIRRYAGSAIERSGRAWKPTAADRLPRMMEVVLPDGITTAVIRDSRERALLGQYYNAIQAYIHDGDRSQLEQLRGRSVTINGQRVELVTDPEALDRLARAGQLDIPDIYQRSN